jgi:AcrR family transcriptional regulator
MNRTKRKIFEIAMKLFSEKGYEATSIEEITATVGVAKGTLYYHFSSKEEIFNFLVEEGMKLLKNSIEIKTSKCDNTKDKLKAIILIQIKAIIKYESVLSIIFSQIYGNENRNQLCQDKAEEYVNVIKNIIDEGIEKGELKKCNSKFFAYTIFSLTSSIMMYKKQTHKEYSISELYHECEFTIFGEI